MNATEAKIVSLENLLKDTWRRVNEAAKRGAGFIIELHQLERDATWWERFVGNYPLTETTKNLITQLKKDGYKVSCKMRYMTLNHNEVLLTISW